MSPLLEMSEAGEDVTAGRICVIAAAVLALMTALQLSTGPGSRDRASYAAGYAAASNSALAQDKSVPPLARWSVVCDQLAQQALRQRQPINVVRDDFISGCTHAFVDVTE